MEFIIDDGEFSTGWTSETASRAETNTSQLGSITIAVHEQYAKPKASQRILDDSSFNLEAWIAQKVSEKFRCG